MPIGHELRKSRRASVCAIALAAPFVGCADGQAPPPRGLELAVATLTLPGIGEVCYDIQVHNDVDGGGEIVWGKGTPNDSPSDGVTNRTVAEAVASGAVCSGRYGNSGGGDIAYVG